MIAYVDTSVLVPLLVRETGSLACRQLWDAADDVVMTRLVYVEASAALARAGRGGRIDVQQQDEATRLLDDHWADAAVIELDEPLMTASAVCARRFGLRGYDAVHCAAAAQLEDPELVAASGDRALLAVWRNLGLATFDPAV